MGAEDQRNFDEKKRVEQARERFAPFTGQRGKTGESPNKWSKIMQGAMAGAQMAQQMGGEKKPPPPDDNPPMPDRRPMPTQDATNPYSGALDMRAGLPGGGPPTSGPGGGPGGVPWSFAQQNQQRMWRQPDQNLYASR
jgi:hypothetical protein